MSSWLRVGGGDHEALAQTVGPVGDARRHLQDTAFLPSIDVDKIGVLGLSMGGNTALLIAGTRHDPELLASYCDINDLNASLCDWVRLSGLDLHAMDKEAAGRDNKDERVRFVMAVDSVSADIFAAETFPGISIPVALVNLGEEAVPGAGDEVIEDPICSDGSGRSRNAIHAQLIELVVATFGRALNSGH